MAQLAIRNLSFTHDGAYDALFKDLNCNLDTDWKLGLVGRNGMGKTTLLKLIQGKLNYSGQIDCPLEVDYFPFSYDANVNALQLLRETIAPYDEMETMMSELLETMAYSEEALSKYGEVQERYQAHDGYIINELITAELGKLMVDPHCLQQPFSMLSGGERTKMMLAALFLKKDNFLLIDEPTDHLDVLGRKMVADYLSYRKGFIIVSHDRVFLDSCIDHLMIIEKQGCQIRQGNFSAYLEDKKLEDELELKKNERLEQQIAVLERSAKQKESWSDRIEKTKLGSADRGYIGARSAAMMKRAKSIERRQEDAIKEKQDLLQNIDYTPELKITTLDHYSKRLISAQALVVGYDSPLTKPLNFEIVPGDRLVLKGANGSGKTTLLKTLLGTILPLHGDLRLASNMTISLVSQDTSFLYGSLRDFIHARNLNESLFKAILRKLDFLRSDFERPMQLYSQGEKKKVLIAASLTQPSHIYFWDEPLNYIDYYSREQLISLIIQYSPTLVFVEHDQYFQNLIATKELILTR